MTNASADAVDIEQILDDEEFILVDASLPTFNPYNGRNWYGDVNNAQFFRELSLDTLQLVTEDLQFFLDILSQSNVYITEGVLQPFVTMHHMLRDNLTYLTQNETEAIGHQYIPNRQGTYRPPRRRGDGQSGGLSYGGSIDRNKNVLEEILQLYNQIFEAARKSVFRENDQRRTALEGLAHAVASHSGAKRDLHAKYGEKPKPLDSHNDELHVAAAFYTSLVAGKPSSIITRSSGIVRLATDIAYLLSSPQFTGVQVIVDILRQCPIKVYYEQEPGIVLCNLDTSKVNLRDLLDDLHFSEDTEAMMVREAQPHLYAAGLS